MRLLRALIAALIAAVASGWDRVRARWYRRQKLPTVRAALDRGTLPASRLCAVEPPAGPLVADDASPDYLSIPSSPRLVRGGHSTAHRIASTRILPPPPLELSGLRPEAPSTTARRDDALRVAARRERPAHPDLGIYRPEPWNVEARRAMALAGFRELRPGERAHDEARPEPTPTFSGVLRPALFGLADDLASARFERRALPMRHADGLVPQRARPTPTQRIAAPSTLGVAQPESFGLSEDARPAAELLPAPRRHPPRLSRARATFVARYVDPHPAERFWKEVPVSLGETMQEGAEAFFDPPAIGAIGRTDEWELDGTLGDLMNEVREQFLLRRDIDRAEYDESELTDIEGVSTNVDEAIQAFTGLTFEDLQPEPFAPLKMRLEAPPPPVAPFIEDAEKRLAWILAAISEHPPEEPGPQTST